jgi:glc operon protein GlcG
LPIVIAGQCVGAVGVGSGTGAQDVEVARAALAAIDAEDQKP